MNTQVNVESEPTVTLILTMSLQEAQALKSIMGAITGSTDGPRGISNAIWKHLDAVEEIYHTPVTGCIDLPDTWEEMNKKVQNYKDEIFSI